jgi:hypothetical protein
MRRHLPILVALAALTATAGALGFAPVAAGASTWRASDGLPPHVFAPYFETYDTTDGGLAALS